MKKNLLKAIGYVDDQLIEKAETYTGVKRKKAWVKWVAAAACVALLLTTTVFANEIIRFNAAVTYLTSLGIPAEDLSDYSRQEIKDAARIIEAKEVLKSAAQVMDAKEALAEGESNGLVDEYYALNATNDVPADTPKKVTSAQIRELTPTMTRKEVLEFLGDTVDVGSGIYIYVYEVDQAYLLNIPFANDDAQLGVNGADLLKALRPIED